VEDFLIIALKRQFNKQKEQQIENANKIISTKTSTTSITTSFWLEHLFAFTLSHLLTKGNLQERISVLILLNNIFGSVSYPGRGFLRPWDRGNVNLVTIPSGPNTDDGILSNESERDFVSADWSCRLHVCFPIEFAVKH
jgi:hypothetical protein